MKKLLILLLFIPLMFACQKDDDVKPEDKATDPCANIVCNNGGVCVNGQCDCPEGYSGPSCDKMVTPSKIIISKIEVRKFAATDNGGGWDNNSGPDLWLTLDRLSTSIFESPVYHSNATPGTVYTFNLQKLSTSPTDKHSLYLYDYDLADSPPNSNDLMFGYTFTLYNSANEFSEVLHLNSGEYEFYFYVSYEW